MTINLTRRSTKGSPLSATDHDTNLDKIEVAIEAREALGAVAAHAAAADPHPGYLTAAEGNAAYATTAQGAKADTAIQPGNAALSDAREWSAATIDQAEAEAGTATTRRAFTAQRVFQAAAAWWAGSAAATKLAGIATGATANATDAQLRDRSTHTGTQAASTITGTLAVANGGTGTATPGLVQGTNVTITGTWPNQQINATGGGGSLTVQDEGSTLSTAVTSINFTGAGVTATGTSSVTVNVPTGSGGNVSSSGTPTSGQAAEWTSATVVQGVAVTGTGSYVKATSPTLVTPILGTPTSGTLTNCTGLPAAGVTGLGTLATQSGTFSGTSSGTNTGDNAVNSLYSGLVSNANHTGDATGSTVLTLATVNLNVGSFGSATVAPIFTVNGKGLITAASTATITPAVGSITGLGTGIATALAINTGTAGAPVLFGGALGTPSAAVLTNATGLPWSTGVTGKPTTLSGYGITDGLTSASLATPPAIGATTPAAGSFTNLTATAELTLPSGAPGTPAARDIYASVDSIRYRDSANTERLLLNSADNLANLGSAATARTNLGLGSAATQASTAFAASGAVTGSGLTMATARLLGRSTAGTGAPEEISIGSNLSLSGGVLSASGGGGGGASFAGYAVGNWIVPTMGTLGAGQATSPNSIGLMPFTVSRAITFSEVAVRVTTFATGASFQLAIYASANGLPTGTPLFSTGSGTTGASLDATGVFNIGVATTTLQPGVLYWQAVNTSTGSSVFLSTTANNSYHASIIGSTTLSEVLASSGTTSHSRFIAQTYGTWPDLTGVTTTVSTTNQRRVPVFAFLVGALP